MGKGTGIDDDACRCAARRMDPVDQLVFPVALGKEYLVARRLGNRAAIGLHIGHRFVAVDFRLALAEQVEVRSVKYGEKAHATPSFVQISVKCAVMRSASGSRPQNSRNAPTA
ncbi:hypothetical protein D3C72_1855890 [compost metagenome]